MEPHTTFATADLDATNCYKLLTGLVTPRPIGWIGTKGADGIDNLAPYSFFNAISAEPPTVLFSVGIGHHVKDSAANAVASGEFTVNIVTDETVEAMNVTAGEHPPHISEFDVAGLTPLPSTLIDAPRVAEATAQLECRVSDVHDIVSSNGEASNRVIFGEVVAIHVADRVLDGTRIRPDLLRSIGRMAGSGYTKTGDGLFQLERPTV
ncbi:MAG: flavin reductase family protein [Acidimicrobiales bacterium]|nr:flavin reductase family protein [Acidimicrobiales bacterium]RZV45545.1 MAG: flavin reductase family protein [Acidimicrobiales bacterium]